jgi:trigger factor
MDVSVENTGAIGRKMTVKIPAADFDQNIESRLATLAKTVKLPGFRPGKVPLKVVEARYSEQVLHEAAEELISSSYHDAVVQESVETAGPPSIEPKTMTRGEDLEYVATFEVFPQIPRTDIAGTSIVRKSCQPEEEDVTRTIETLRKRRTIWEAGESAAEEGDRLLIDFKGSVNGEPFEGGEAENYPVILGGSTLLPEFEAQLTDLKTGDQGTVDLTFPEDYPNEELAGQPAKFSVDVREVAKPKLPEIDEDFIKSFGVEEGTDEAFRNQILANLEKECSQKVRSDTHEAVMEALLLGNDFEVPETLIREETERAVTAARGQMQQQGLPADTPVDPEQFRSSAERRVRLGLVMHTIVKQREIKPDDNAVRQRLEDMASSYDDPQQFIKWYSEDRSRLSQVEAAVVEDHVVEALLTDANVTDSEVSFEDLMNPTVPDIAQS